MVAHGCGPRPRKPGEKTKAGGGGPVLGFCAGVLCCVVREKRVLKVSHSGPVIQATIEQEVGMPNGGRW